MDNELKFDIKKMRVSYLSFRYSHYFPVIIPAVLVLSFLMILWLFFIPQVQSWFSIQDEIKFTQERIENIKENIQVLEFSNVQTVDQDFITARTALPSDKDFATILATLSTSASVAKITLDDFSFSLGKISSKDATISAQQDPSIIIEDNGTIPVRVVVTAGGTVNDINTFVREIERRLPITEVISVDYSEGKGQVALSFFTKPFPDIVFNDTQPLKELNAEERQMIRKLSQSLE